MDVKKPVNLPEPGYPSRRQFADSAKLFGIAAIGLGAFAGRCAAADAPPRMAGVPPMPPPPKEEPAKPGDTVKPAPPPKVDPAPEQSPVLAGKIRVEPKPEPPPPPAELKK